MNLLPNKPTFYEAYLEYQTLYISEYSSEKFRKTYDVIINSSRINNLLQLSVDKGAAPVGSDFINEIFLIPYFILAKNDTRAIGALIALNYWNEKVNAWHKFADEKSMLLKVKDIFGNLRMIY